VLLFSNLFFKFLICLLIISELVVQNLSFSTLHLTISKFLKGKRSQWMIPPSNRILHVFTKIKAATVIHQMKAVMSEFTACSDGKMTLFLSVSKK